MTGTVGLTHEVDLPWTAPPLSLNHRRNRYARAAKIAEVRKAAWALVRQARIGSVDKVRVTLHYRPRVQRRRDEDNLVDTLKACCDGIVDARVVKDDTRQYMEKLMPVLHEPSSVSGLKPRLWLEIEVLAL